MTRPKAKNSPPDDLTERGRALWDWMTERLELSGSTGVVALEACRCVDRLDRLDAMLRADANLWATVEYRGKSMQLQIDSALGEARQLQTTLAALFKALGLRPEVASRGQSDIARLAQRRQARLRRA